MVPLARGATGRSQDLLQTSTPPATFLYAWAGPNKPSRFKLRNRGADCIATIDANLGSSAFGSVVSTTNVPTRVGFGSEPHHVGVSGDMLVAGGLFSYRIDTSIGKFHPSPDMMFFNISKALQAQPEFIDSAFGVAGAVTDSFLFISSADLPESSPGKDKPRLLATLMGDREGGGPGKLAEVQYVDDENKWEVVAEFDGGLDGSKDPGFLPHGMDRNGPAGNILVTTDYLKTSSSWKPTSGFEPASTVRVWDLAARKVVAVWDLNDLPGGVGTAGLMSVRYTGKDSMFFFTAGLGILYVLDASKRPGTDSIESAVWPFYSMLQEGPPFTQTVEGSCVLSAIFSVPADPSQKRMIITSLSLSQVRLLDVTDVFKAKTLQTIQLAAGSQPHVVAVNGASSQMSAGTLAAVATYYVEQDPKKGLWSSVAEKAVHIFKLADEKNSMMEVAFIDFKTAFPGRVLRPHGLAFVTK